MRTSAVRKSRVTVECYKITPSDLKGWLITDLCINKKYIDQAIKELNNKTLFTNLYKGIEALRDINKKIIESGCVEAGNEANQILDRLLMRLIGKLSLEVAESQTFVDEPLQTVVGPDYLKKIKSLKDGDISYPEQSGEFLATMREQLVEKIGSLGSIFMPKSSTSDVIDSTIARLAIFYYLRTRG